MHVPQTDSKNLFSVTGKWSLDPSCPLQTERLSHRSVGALQQLCADALGCIVAVGCILKPTH